MKIDEKNMNQFIEKFETTIFPTIKGKDGKGLERLKEVVEKKKQEVAARNRIKEKRKENQTK